jgi:hypothetical protein
MGADFLTTDYTDIGDGRNYKMPQSKKMFKKNKKILCMSIEIIQKNQKVCN